MVRWFKAAKVPGVIIGGVAVSMHAQPRYTRDLDALVIVRHGDLPRFVARALKYGFSARVPDPIEFARDTRMLLFRHQAKGFPLDISLGALAFEEDVIRRATILKVGTLRIPVAAPEDLIILKAIAD